VISERPAGPRINPAQILPLQLQPAGYASQPANEISTNRNGSTRPTGQPYHAPFHQAPAIPTVFTGFEFLDITGSSRGGSLQSGASPATLEASFDLEGDGRLGLNLTRRIGRVRSEPLPVQKEAQAVCVTAEFAGLPAPDRNEERPVPAGI
jgi:hypothetical protein